MSRIIRPTDGTEAVPLDCKTLGEATTQGVLDFVPRQVGPGTSEPEPDPEADLETPATPPEIQIDVEAIRKEAFEQGFSEGETQGRETAQAALQATLESLGQAASDLAGFKAQLRLDVEREVVDLAFSIARRVLRRELSIDPTVALGIVRGCLEEFSGVEVHRMEIHPADAKVVAPYFEGRGGPPIDIVANEKLSRGGAVFETKQGALDARLEAQIAEIENGLADRWAPSGHSL